MTTDTHLRDDYPDWVARLVTLPPVFFAIVSITDPGNAWPVVAAAVAVAVTPWIIDALHIPLSLPLFAAWVTIPIAALNLLGGQVGVDLSGESHTQFSLMIIIWLLGQMAATAPAALVWTVGVATVGTIAGRAVVEPAFGHAWMFWAGGAGIAVVTGFMLRRQHQTLAELREAQAALADEAVQRERQRIAREVHDVVAHTLTVTLMHLRAAQRALDRDPAAVREALEDAEVLGRRSLADIRRTVGLLRAEGDAPETRALPDATDVADLLASYRAAGVRLTADIALDLDTLGPAAGLTLYRLVQESLSNAAAHSPGAPVDLTIGVEDGLVTVEISNPAPETVTPRSTDGLGLVGMEERVRLLDGRFRAGHRDGRWTVHASFPVHAALSGSEVTA